MTASSVNAQAPRVSVIIPARNEEASLGACLESLTEQQYYFEIIVVNDHSTDRTREIAASMPGVQVVDADPLLAGWTGKNNALATGVRHARTHWFLFTDADTIHQLGSLERAMDEARHYNADMLSYSPEQIAVTFWEMAVLPVVFAELARQFPPSKVSDPNSPVAAANGQYILISREAYEAVGGHAAIAEEILEDVALARRVKASGRKIRFRYGADAVRTRMYRSFAQLREGWTKNLALLFPNPGALAAKTLVMWAIPWAALLLMALVHTWWLYMVGILVAALNAWRLRRANFGLMMEFLSVIVGMPMFAYLLLRSQRMHRKGTVSWKGRVYRGKEQDSSNTTDARLKNVMKSVLPLILFSFLLIAVTRPLTAQSDATSYTKTIIEGGVGVGPLKLGDPRAMALAEFPKKDEDQQWDDSCGTTLDWIDATNPMGRGELLIRLHKDKIFQIESATTRFHTAEDITTFDPPEKVREHYKDMRAYTLLTQPSPALGDRPLVFWVDKKKGIAFALAWDPSRHKRYVYKIIVFEANKDFCPEQEKTSSPKWQQIPPYATEPPRELSPER